MAHSEHDVIVVGGGPAGSTAAAVAAKRGLRVLLLESGAHPRPHVGESLLPGVIPILDEIGALDEVEAAGFTRKSGATYWDWGRTPSWDLWFADTDAYDHAWLVERARFDEILFRAAQRAGADAREHAKASKLKWDGERLVGVEHSGGEVARAPVTIDASGQSSLIAASLGLRSPIPSMRHRAAWAYYEGAGRLPPPRENQALLAADARHWLWVFPLTDELTSVGIVFQDAQQPDDRAAREAHFDAAVRDSARVAEVLGPNAVRVSRVTSQRDWSYRMLKVCGPGWLLAGDASGFVDPILSTGVMLAMHAGHRAGVTAGVIARGERAESAALADYERAQRGMFDDMLRMAKFFYQRNLDRADYFWESKAILENEIPGIDPQKAFLILTSGLVKNLALDERRIEVLGRRARAAAADAPDLETHDPDELGFVCIQMTYQHGSIAVPMYLLIEPVRPADPALFSTASWHVNCLAPRLGNDPISVPELAPHLRGIGELVRRLDDRPGESLAAFWRRTRDAIADHLAALPDELSVIRIFGE